MVANAACSFSRVKSGPARLSASTSTWALPMPNKL
jgi:hypothetical protein